MKLFKRTIIVGLLLSTLSACGSSADSASNFVESGKEFAAEGMIHKARIEFKNAIQVDPRMAEPFYQLALLDEKEQKWKAMVGNLNTAEQLDPTHHEAIVRLGQINLLAGNFELATEKADKVIAADESNILAWVLRASIAMKQQKFDDAMRDIEHAISLDPKNVEALSVKTLLLNQKGESLKALSVIDKALSIKPDELPLTMIKVSILESQKNYKALEDIYRNLLRQRPDESWIALSLAKLLNSQERYDDAKQVLEEFVASYPEDKKAKILLVSLMKTKEPENAISLLSDYIKQDPENFELRFIKAKLQFEQNETEPAIETIKQIASMDEEGANGIKAKIMLARFDLKQNDRKAALQKLESVLAVAPEDEGALLLRGRIRILNKNIDAAMSDLRIVLRNNPESEQALVLLAQAYMSSGSKELADDSFRQALVVNPGNTIAALSVATNLMETNELDKTEEVLTKALGKSTENKEPLLLALAQVRVMKKDWAGMTPVIKELQVDNKDTALTHYFKGQVAQGQSLYETAAAEFKAALEQKPDMPRALQGFAVSMMRLDKKDELITYLNGYIESNPAQYTAYGMLSSIYIQDKNWDEAITTLEQGIAQEATWQQGYSTLASVYLAQDKAAKAESVYQRGLDANKDSSFLMLQMAAMYERNEQFEKAVKLYEDILVINPDIEPAINNLASLLSDHFLTDENLKKAEALSKRFAKSSQPYFIDTYAWTQVLLGNYSQAQGLLERVVSLSPDVAVFNYHIGMLHLKQGNQLEAKNYLNIAKSLAEKQADKITAENIEKALQSM